MRAEEAVRVIESSELFWLRPTADETTALSMAIEALKTAKHGRWDLIDACEPVRYGCSVCHRMVWHYENYCPSCGALMDEEVQP